MVLLLLLIFSILFLGIVLLMTLSKATQIQKWISAQTVMNVLFKESGFVGILAISLPLMSSVMLKDWSTCASAHTGINKPLFEITDTVNLDVSVASIITMILIQGEKWKSLVLSSAINILFILISAFYFSGISSRIIFEISQSSEQAIYFERRKKRKRSCYFCKSHTERTKRSCKKEKRKTFETHFFWFTPTGKAGIYVERRKKETFELLL